MWNSSTQNHLKLTGLEYFHLQSSSNVHILDTSDIVLHLSAYKNVFFDQLCEYGSASDCYFESGKSHEAPSICTAPIKVCLNIRGGKFDPFTYKWVDWG